MATIEERNAQTHDAVFGFYDPAKNKNVDGILDVLGELKKSMEINRLIDSWLLRLLVAFVVLRFVGIEHLSDLARVFH